MIRALIAECSPETLGADAFAPGYFPFKMEMAAGLIVHAPRRRRVRSDGLKALAFLRAPGTGSGVTGRLKMLDNSMRVI